MMNMPRRLLVIALAGLAAVLAAAWLDAHTLMAAWLATVVTLGSIAAGAGAVLMVTYLVRGNWTEALHVPLTAAALTAPVAGILFIPVLIAIPWLYPWAQGSGAEGGAFKAVWLTPFFFALRTVLYFVVWTTLALWLRRAWAHPHRMIVSASVGLIVYALTASLAGIDWLEALTPEFHSSIYGLLFLTLQLLAGFAFALIIALAPPGAPTFRYGAILLSIILLWAYNHAMQYIIIWSANIPEEAVWYVRREAGAWGVALWTLVVLQFILPFFAMLSERVRNERRPLLALAALTLGCRFLEAYVLALPGMDMSGAALALGITGSIVLAGALWWTGFTFVYEHLRSSAADTQPLPDAFDSSGNPVSPRPAS